MRATIAELLFSGEPSWRVLTGTWTPLLVDPQLAGGGWANETMTVGTLGRRVALTMQNKME